MKPNKAILKILILLALITALALPSFSQTSVSPIVSKEETVSFLIRQNENARELIKSQDARIADLESQLVSEKDYSASVAKSYDSAKSEIESLKAANSALSRAVAINENTINLLQADNSKQKEKARKATKDKWVAYLVTGGVIALKFLL